MNSPPHHPMLLSENNNCSTLKPYMKDHHQTNPFETTFINPSSKGTGNFYLQDFHHLDHHHHNNIASSSLSIHHTSATNYDPFDAFPNYNYGFNYNNVKPFAAAAADYHHSVGNGQVMDNFQSGGFLNHLSHDHQRNPNVNVIDVMGSSSDHMNGYMPFDLQHDQIMRPVNFVVPDEISSVSTAENAYYKKVGMNKNNRVLTSSPPRIAAAFKGGRKKSNLVKGQWITEEDRLLIQLVEQYGVRKWSLIAQMLPGRIGKQCRERWHNHLRPDIKKDTWSEEEDKVLIQAHIEIGNKWAEIAKRLPGRTENSIKNHWNATKRRQFSKRKCRSKYPRGSILQEYIKSLNLDVHSSIASSSTKFQDKSSKGTAATTTTTTTTTNDASTTADKSTSTKASIYNQAQALDVGLSADDRLVPEYDFNEVPDFSFDEKLLHENCSLESLLDDIPSADDAADYDNMDIVPVDMVPEVKKELDLVEMISQQANLSN